MEPDVFAIRRSVALSTSAHVQVARVSGPDCYAFLDRLLTSDLYMRDGELRQSLFLDDDGRILADVTAGTDGDGYLLLVEGIRDLAPWLEAQRAAGERVDVEALAETHALLSLDGPYAWELLAELEGPSILGLPYASFHRPRPDRLILRAGKTGEYGYGLLVPKREAAPLLEAVLARGERFDLARAGAEALWSCALENGFFTFWREGRAGLDPLELQLRWRLSNAKSFRGAAALAERRKRQTHRITTLRAASALAEGAAITCGGEAIGRVIVAEPSRSAGGWVALGLIALPYAESGVGAYLAGGVPVRTVSPPIADNLSLRVRPDRDAYARRA